MARDIESPVGPSRLDRGTQQQRRRMQNGQREEVVRFPMCLWRVVAEAESGRKLLRPRCSSAMCARAECTVDWRSRWMLRRPTNAQGTTACACRNSLPTIISLAALPTFAPTTPLLETHSRIQPRPCPVPRSCATSNPARRLACPLHVLQCLRATAHEARGGFRVDIDMQCGWEAYG